MVDEDINTLREKIKKGEEKLSSGSSHVDTSNEKREITTKPSDNEIDVSHKDDTVYNEIDVSKHKEEVITKIKEAETDSFVWAPIDTAVEFAVETELAYQVQFNISVKVPLVTFKIADAPVNVPPVAGATKTGTALTIVIHKNNEKTTKEKIARVLLLFIVNNYRFCYL